MLDRRKSCARWLRLVGLFVFVTLALPLHAGDDEAYDRKPFEFGPPQMPAVRVPTVFHYTRSEGPFEPFAKRRRITLHAWLANPLKTPLENVEAKLSTRNTAIKIEDGTLHFLYVRANSSAPAYDTFTIEFDSHSKLDFDDFIWTVGVPLAGQPKEWATTESIGPIACATATAASPAACSENSSVGE